VNGEEKSFLKKCIKRLGRNSSVVEVGSWKGGSAYVMLSTAKRTGNPIKFFFIDPWDYSPGAVEKELEDMAEGRNIFEEFTKKLSPFRGKYKAIQDSSVNASKRFLAGSLDMVFVDGDHTREGCLADIKAWYPKVCPGGIICGHDYGRKKYGVTEAVNEFFAGTEFNIENPARSMWRVIKPGG